MNPFKAADDGALRSALVPNESAAASTLTPLDAFDWIRAGSYTPDSMSHGRHPDGTAGHAIVLVDPDSSRRATRRGHLSSGGAARVITASDEFDVADAMRLMDPDVVIVSASDTVTCGNSERLVLGDPAPRPRRSRDAWVGIGGAGGRALTFVAIMK